MRRRLNSRAFDPFDEWLETLGLYRKQVARDGSCLFRAVAEQIFMTQTEHERVRSLCLEYMMLYKEDFQPFLEVPLDHHVYNLQDVREWGGHTEIIAMSRLFKVDFQIYQHVGQPPIKLTENGHPKTLMLSYTHGNHYDIVYKKEDAALRGFCQSALYELLYSQVFHLKDVRVAVDTMLHDKEYATLRRDSANSTELKEIGALVEKILGTSISRDNSQDEADKNTSVDEKTSTIEEIHPDDVRGLLAHGIPPFPYKVAKSLDPDLYRNIEYDAWNTLRREARFGPFDSNGFQAGVKVMIHLELLPNREEVEQMRKTHHIQQNSQESEGKVSEAKVNAFHGHIQIMSENKGPVDVYVEEIGCRLKVPYESLEKIPPSPPRSPWHQQQQQQQQQQVCSGVTAAGGAVQNYKKLTGFYKKAPLSTEPEFSAGRKKAGKHSREVLTIFPVTSPARYHNPHNNSGMRGRSMASPHSQSPRGRQTQGPSNFASKNYSNHRMIRGQNPNYRNTGSPGRDGFPPLQGEVNIGVGVEGVWTVHASSTQAGTTTPQPSGVTYYTPPQPPPVGGDNTQLKAVTDALQQVMSAGGQQEVRVTGQQLEVVTIEEHGGNVVIEECSGSSNTIQVYSPLPSVDGNVSSAESPGTMVPATPDGFEGHQQEPESDGGKMNLDTTSPVMVGGSPSPQSMPLCPVNYPQPYPSPGYVQVYSPLPSIDGSINPAESPGTVMPAKHDGLEVHQQDPESDGMKMNLGTTSPVMVYQVPIMYGGYGYGGYNQPWTYSFPMAPPPGADTSKQPPQGGESYPQMMPGWPQGFVGDMYPQPPVPGPPHHTYPPHIREPSPTQMPYPPQPFHPEVHEGRERPFRHYNHHHNYRGRGRGGGGPPYYNNRGNHHHNNYFNNNHGNMGRGGGGQRSLPPRFQRGGGAPPGRGGPRNHYQNSASHAQNMNNSSQPNQRHLYEGQPLHMGSRKSSSENLSSQVVPSPNMGSGGLVSPPLVPLMDSDRTHGVVPFPPQEAPTMSPQDQMLMPGQAPPGYYPPPGYVVTGPWMWKMM